MTDLNYLMTSRKILFAGLLTGLLDILAAIVKFYIETGRGPEPIFRYIASGIFGRKAFGGGSEMITWGILLHFAIAIIFAGIFLSLFPVVFRTMKSWITTGVLFGLAAWVIMNFIVVPLSHVPKPTFELLQAIIAAVILITMIGLPLAYIGRKNLKKPTAIP